MATQVETLLPNNPLVKQEEHGHASKMIHGDDCLDTGAKQTGVVDESSNAKGDCPEQGGFVKKEQSSKQAKEESNNQEKDNLDQGAFDNKHTAGDSDDDAKCNRKEFTEAPPPKVNPWTKKMNAVTVVSVNGQAHHGLYSSTRLTYVMSPVLFFGVIQPSHLATTLAYDGGRHKLVGSSAVKQEAFLAMLQACCAYYELYSKRNHLNPQVLLLVNV